jgi:methylglutaconyl-CoA hydratase
VSDPQPATGDASGPLQLRRDGDLLFATLADPGRANALSPALVAALTDLYRRPLLSEGVRAVVLAADGRHFSAGADLAHLASLQGASLADNRADSRRLRDLFHAVLSQEALTVALVHGSCIAGGCGLATAHDFVVAADDARFMYSEVKIGFVAALVATFLPLRVRGSDLRELLLFPRLLPAGEALALGIANRVVPRGDLASAGLALVEDVLANASSQSIARTKRLLLDLLGRPLAEALDLAAEQNAHARLTADCQRGIATFLAEKKAPAWR